MSRAKARTAVSLCALAAAALSPLALAGDLNPPVGPVAPTMKNLDTVEPRIPIGPDTTPGDANSTFRISQAGSYYLTGNVTGEDGKHGIEISSEAGPVTIDLMGFTLQGVVGSQHGITDEGSFFEIRILNGTIRGWNGYGIIVGNGFGQHIKDVHVSNNGGYGIFCRSNAVIESCTAYANGIHGIFGSGPNVTVRNCAAFSNASHGIIIGSTGVVTASTAYANSGNGIATGEGCLIAHSSAHNNFASGFEIGPRSTVTSCTARVNLESGIEAFIGSTVSNCTSTGNIGSGIQASTSCLITGNNCEGNGAGGGSGAGVHVIGSDSRIESNNCTNNDRGIDVDSPDNLIIHNSCSGNTSNYDIVANNKVGVIVSAPLSMAINGTTGGAGVGTTDPWANLSF